MALVYPARSLTKVDDKADAIRTERAVLDLDVVCGFAETKHRAGSWTRSHRIVARFFFVISCSSIELS